MYRRIPCLALVLGAGLALTLPSLAQEAAAPPLPLKDVVLFSSGVGYFQREGRITGAAAVPLSFRAEQVNDILKSLVLFDPAGGVRPVTYGLKDATSRRLATVGQALDPSVSLGGLLRKLQGAQVGLATGGQVIEGRVISISQKAMPVKDGVVQAEVVNLLTRDGLRAVTLDQVTEVMLLDARLKNELREALELLARGLDEQREQVELRFGGEGAREVRAGYLQETPVWKTSYRLVLEPGVKPYLQGWAIVENTTEEDWNQVRLSLVSGRPVSFIQDLHQPLYVPRPVVQAQVIGSPVPQTYGETLATDPAAVADAREQAKKAMGLGFGFGGGGLGGAAGPPAAPSADRLARREAAAMSAAQLAGSVASQAAGTERGDLFEYAIRQPLTLPRGRAAMVPIVTGAVEGEALSIYDPASDGDRALNGFRLKNSTGLHLSGGPITVFQEGIYGGDAQITNLQPGEDRLLSFAVDLDLVVDHQEPKLRQETTDVAAKSGVLVVTRKQQREHLYTFRNKSERAKTVLVQQAREDEFKLAEPAKPLETTAEAYRFRLDVPAGKNAELKVVTERPLTETIALLNADLNLLVSHAQNARASEKLRAALKQLVAQRRKIVDLQAERAKVEAELTAIDQEQGRIRKNMEQLDRNSPLYQQYVKKLTEQESRIEKLRADAAALRAAEAAAQKELRDFVDTLTVE